MTTRLLEVRGPLGTLNIIIDAVASGIRVKYIFPNVSIENDGELVVVRVRIFVKTLDTCDCAPITIAQHQICTIVLRANGASVTKSWQDRAADVAMTRG